MSESEVKGPVMANCLCCKAPFDIRSSTTLVCCSDDCWIEMFIKEISNSEPANQPIGITKQEPEDE